MGLEKKEFESFKRKKNSWRCLIDLRFSDKRSWFKTMVVGVPFKGLQTFLKRQHYLSPKAIDMT